MFVDEHFLKQQIQSSRNPTRHWRVSIPHPLYVSDGRQKSTPRCRAPAITQLGSHMIRRQWPTQWIRCKRTEGERLGGELMTVGWLVGRQPLGDPASVSMGEHKELKLTCSMIPRRENPLRDYIHNMLRLWNCIAGGDKEHGQWWYFFFSSTVADYSHFLFPQVPVHSAHAITDALNGTCPKSNPK